MFLPQQQYVFKLALSTVIPTHDLLNLFSIAGYFQKRFMSSKTLCVSIFLVFFPLLPSEPLVLIF
jgi:hypothetical protein